MPFNIWVNMNRDVVNLDYMEAELLKAGFNIRIKPVDNSNNDEILAMGKWADVVVSGLEVWSPERLSAVQGNLKFLLRFGTGVDNIDIQFATSLGIVVANIPGANAPAVAEAALLHMLNLGRRLSIECYQGKNTWHEASIGTELEGKTVGIIGFGNIGKHLARMLTGFNVKILVFDPIVKVDVNSYKVHVVQNYEEIFRECDIVSLHVPLTPDTKHMVNNRTLALMKKTAYVINTCRGDVIDEEALSNALNSGLIAGAGLDVLSVEPGHMDSKLLGIKNAIISPHIGGRTKESVIRSQCMLIQAIKDYFNGKIPFNTINPEVLKIS